MVAAGIISTLRTSVLNGRLSDSSPPSHSMCGGGGRIQTTNSLIPILAAENLHQHQHSYILRKYFQTHSKQAIFWSKIKMGSSAKLNKMADGGLKNFIKIQLLSCQASESPPLSFTSFKLSISLHSYFNIFSTLGSPGGPVHPILLTQHAWDGARYNKHYLSRTDTAGRPGFNAPTTAPESCYTDMPLTRPGLPPTSIILSAVPSDVITFLAHQTSAGIL